MEQMITKEQIAEAAEQYAEQENSAWTNDYNGFEAGANFVMQLLQQTPYTAKCVFHSTDWNGKCFICGEQAFIREPK